MKKQILFSLLAGASILFISAGYSGKEPVTRHGQHAPVPKAAYKIYVGKYQMSPARILTITEENGRLFGEPTGEQKVELHPEAEHVFTIKEFNGRVTFVVDTKGEVTQALINLQNKDIVAKKLEEK